MTRRRRDVARLARRYNLNLETSNSSHWLLRDQAGHLVTSIARTPGTRDYLRIAEDDIRRGLRQFRNDAA